MAKRISTPKRKASARKVPVNVRIRRLMKALEADFPRLKRAVLKAVPGDDIDEAMQFVLSPPGKLGRVPTMQAGVSRELTPMLRARFEYASTIQHGIELWLGLEQMASWPRKRDFRGNHRARREYWIDSPPNLLPDSRLSVFGITDDVPQNVVYLIWGEGGEEPRLWSCSGMSSEEYDTLEDFLTRQLRD